MRVNKEVKQEVLDAIKEAFTEMEETDIADINNDYCSENECEEKCVYSGMEGLDDLVSDVFDGSFSSAYTRIEDKEKFNQCAEFFAVKDCWIISADSVFDVLSIKLDTLAKYVLRNTERDSWGVESGYAEINDAINSVLGDCED